MIPLTVVGAADRRTATLAACIVHQQAAGFLHHVDAREAVCPDCGSSGFNTGWGAWLFACGAEVLSDGTESTRCGEARR